MIVNKKDLSAGKILFLGGVILIALIVNCCGAVLATKIQFPLYLDSVLTIGVTAIGGLIKNDSYEIEAFLWAGVWSALSNAILGNIIADLLFGSRTNRQNIECTVHGIFIVTRKLRYSTYLAGFIENITDKLISAVLSFGFYEGARRIYKKI